MKLKSIFLILPLLLTACASQQQSAVISVEPAPVVAQTAESGVLLGALANSQIPEGKCGMVLWTLDAKRPQPVVRFVSGGTGDILLNNVPTVMTLIHASGASGFGIYENLEFQNENGVQIKVSVQFGQGFDGGNYLHRGLITVEEPGGWRSVTPAAGIAGCRS